MDEGDAEAWYKEKENTWKRIEELLTEESQSWSYEEKGEIRRVVDIGDAMLEIDLMKEDTEVISNDPNWDPEEAQILAHKIKNIINGKDIEEGFQEGGMITAPLPEEPRPRSKTPPTPILEQNFDHTAGPPTVKPHQKIPILDLCSGIKTFDLLLRKSNLRDAYTLTIRANAFLHQMNDEDEVETVLRPIIWEIDITPTPNKSLKEQMDEVNRIHYIINSLLMTLQQTFNVILPNPKDLKDEKIEKKSGEKV